MKRKELLRRIDKILVRVVSEVKTPEDIVEWSDHILSDVDEYMRSKTEQPEAE